MNTPINSDMPYLMPILELKKHLPQDLCKIIDYYAILIEVLRAKLPERITYTVADKAKIARAGHEIKNHLGQTINLVTPATIMRWFRELKSGIWFYNNACAKTGRPPISPDAVAIIVRLASDKQMGYRSIQGELKKLGHKVSANTIKRVLREHGFPIGGKKFGLKWSEFIRINMKVTWACDFITTDISTPQGFVRLYSLFFLHHGSRTVFYAGTTHSPNKRWVKQQARNFSMHLQEHPEYPCKYLIHDRDGALKPLKHVLKHEGIKTVLTPPETPQANAFIERFMGEVRPIVDSFILVGESQIRQICRTIADHHNRHRPHQGIGNVIPGGYDYPDSPAKPEEVRCVEKLGGLLRHYYVEKKAA